MVAAVASFSRKTLALNSCSRNLLMAKFFKPRILGEVRTSPFSESTRPAKITPIASGLFNLNLSSSEWPIFMRSSASFFLPRCRTVGFLCEPNMLPESSPRTAEIFVPPTSKPRIYLGMQYLILRKDIKDVHCNEFM